MNIILTKYLTKNYLKTILVVSFAFTCLSVILNLFEEQSFFKDHSYSNIFLPLLMSLLKTPEILYSLFPFVILVSSIFVFLQLFCEHYSFFFNPIVIAILLLQTR